jgi:hypothetical protein
LAKIFPLERLAERDRRVMGNWTKGFCILTTGRVISYRKEPESF